MLLAPDDLDRDFLFFDLVYSICIARRRANARLFEKDLVERSRCGWAEQEQIADVCDVGL